MIRTDLMQDFCGCCGRELPAERRDHFWCAECQGHVRNGKCLAPWDRTYSGQTGKPCPFEVEADPDGDPAAMAMQEAV